MLEATKVCIVGLLYRVPTFYTHSTLSKMLSVCHLSTIVRPNIDLLLAIKIKLKIYIVYPLRLTAVMAVQFQVLQDRTDASSESV